MKISLKSKLRDWFSNGICSIRDFNENPKFHNSPPPKVSNSETASSIFSHSKLQLFQNQILHWKSSLKNYAKHQYLHFTANPSWKGSFSPHILLNCSRPASGQLSPNFSQKCFAPCNMIKDIIINNLEAQSKQNVSLTNRHVWHDDERHPTKPILKHCAQRNHLMKISMKSELRDWFSTEIYWFRDLIKNYKFHNFRPR